MIIDLEEDQIHLLLKTLGTACLVHQMQGKPYPDLQNLLKTIYESLQKQDSTHIFHDAFPGI